MEVGDTERVERAAVWAREMGLRPYTFNPSPPREPGPIGPAMGAARPLGRFGFERMMTNDGFLTYQRVPLDLSEWEIVEDQRGGIAVGGDGGPADEDDGAREADADMAEACSHTGDTTVSASPRSGDDAIDSDVPRAIFSRPAPDIDEESPGPSARGPRLSGNPRATSAMAGPPTSRFHEHLDRGISAPPMSNFRIETRRRIERQEARDRNQLTTARLREWNAGVTATRIARAVGRGANALPGTSGQRAGGEGAQGTKPTGPPRPGGREGESEKKRGKRPAWRGG
ncbi:hypothetical protein LTR53_004118 [Teratosphaeriaceae sp. CCFEE 6253]|nr:hypothetical protein LTR53_004118 [Teratosphaeriaceae sp. CCFEE 6253]